MYRSFEHRLWRQDWHLFVIKTMEDSFLAHHRVLAFAGVAIFAKQNWNSKYWLALQIFNFTIAILSFIGTSVFCVLSIDDLPAFTEGACIWTTGVIMLISMTICLIFRNEFRSFVEEMCFADTILTMPIIRIAVKQEGQDGALNELRRKVRDSQKDLFRLTKILLKFYVTVVFLTAVLYVGSALFQMIVREDKSQHILGTYDHSLVKFFSLLSIWIRFCTQHAPSWIVLTKIPAVGMLYRVPSSLMLSRNCFVLFWRFIRKWNGNYPASVEDNFTLPWRYFLSESICKLIHQ